MRSNYYIKLRVLHVEDDAEVVRLVRRFLRSLHYADTEVTNVSTLQEALDRVQVDFFDCVLLDLNLPDSEGITTFHMMYGSTDVPIVVLTAEDDLYDRLELVSAGAQDCLYKLEMTPDSLFRSLRFAVERHRTTLELRFALREAEHAKRTLDALITELHGRATVTRH